MAEKVESNSAYNFSSGGGKSKKVKFDSSKTVFDGSNSSCYLQKRKKVKSTAGV